MPKVYTLDKRIVRMLEVRGKDLHCEVCGETLEASQVVVSKLSYKNHVKLYHRECFQKLWR